MSALLLAARRGDSPQICEFLLSQGAAIWTRSKAGTTALAEAAAAAAVAGGESTVALLMDSAIAKVRKRCCFAPFCTKHDDFAKTGSGQT